VPIDGKLADRLADEPEDKQIKLLYELIEGLTDEEKTIIFLYIDRLKTSQIALATGKSESAVRQIISRTKIKLRMLYEKEKENDR
jgi:RNA polymerase sigma factor (sigma-70 family)